MCILLQSQDVNTFSGQSVLRGGVEDCISYNTVGGPCAFGYSSENRPPKFQSGRYWIKNRESRTDVGVK